MDNATRIKALARLAQSTSGSAQGALKSEFDEASALLADSTSYDDLEHSLEVIKTIGFRFSKFAVSAVDSFNRSIEQRHLEYSAEYAGLSFHISKYRNAQTLISKGIEVLSGLRYMQTPAVTLSLLWASTHSTEKLSNEALAALSSLAKYNLGVFSGTESRHGIGAQPQLQVLETLEAIPKITLIAQSRGVLKLLEGTLSTAMERTEWSSTTMTLYRGVTPATPEVVAVRSRSIKLLCDLYREAEDKRLKLAILRALTSAARPERGGTTDQDYADLIAQNARSVLSFFEEAASTADLQLVQKIEHDSYWIHFHTDRPDVKEAALSVKRVIDANHEYGIYKTLIGFEGIFGDWTSDDRSALRALGSQEHRTALAREYVLSISDENVEQWRTRILKFASTESEDLATFPVFFRFLEEFAKSQPKLALALLVENSESLAPFAIPLIAGLWNGQGKTDARQLIVDWVEQAQTGNERFLIAGIRLFLSTTDLDMPLLQAMYAKAAELRSVRALNQVAAVSIAQYASASEAAPLKSLFLSCIQLLTQLADASWVEDIWFRAEAKHLVGGFNEDERGLVLKNLRALASIDYQAEEILSVLAVSDPGQVIEFFCARALQDEKADSESSTHERFEAIPFDFHHLQEPLSKDATEAVRIVLRHYKNDSTLFQFRGAKLLHNIFPAFSEAFESELTRLVKTGEESDVEFVLSVLSAYSGEDFLYPLCKVIVKSLPQGSALLKAVAVVLESSGVVMGEFGMSDAYERKRLAVLDWLDDADDNVRAFATSYTTNLEAMRDGERRRAEEGIALRKFRYGET